jgi:hypothetical protein
MCRWEGLCSIVALSSLKFHAMFDVHRSLGHEAAGAPPRYPSLKKQSAGSPVKSPAGCSCRN